MKKTKLMLGDNIESLRKLPDNSIDSVVTDPPYGLSFMNKKWDHDVPSIEFWKEVYRVLKPGGHVLSFGGTRTYHRMTVNIEDAGFEIRDQIMWLYGSGFPKSHNIGKAVDKIQGNEREVIGTLADKDPRYASPRNGSANNELKYGSIVTSNKDEIPPLTKGYSKWEGWGTALKPANEPICVARKPLSEKTIADNVLKWGTGGINIDGCRVGSEEKPVFDKSNQQKGNVFDVGSKRTGEYTTEGRFPANIILECTCDDMIKGETGSIKISNNGTANYFPEQNTLNKGVETKHYNDKGDIHTDPNCPCRVLDEQSGLLKSGDGKSGKHKINRNGNTDGVCKMDMGKSNDAIHYGDKGGASRFFYNAKVSKKERNEGLEGFEEKSIEGLGHGLDRICSICEAPQLKPCDCEGNKWIVRPKKNTHPTVKPISLMAYLCRLITPQGGLVLDPFMGSGSTGCAAIEEGFRFAGMEMEEQYFEIAKARIENSYKKKYEREND